VEKLFSNPIALIFILIIVMMVFGLGKLPEVGSNMGKAIRNFRDSSKSEDDSADDEAEEAPVKKTRKTPVKQIAAKSAVSKED
jgi:sec-independent protein translocase protein TatA